jgi:hypothetical protein
MITLRFLTQFSLHPPRNNRILQGQTQTLHRNDPQRRKRRDIKLGQTPTKILQAISSGRETLQFQVYDITGL